MLLRLSDYLIVAFLSSIVGHGYAFMVVTLDGSCQVLKATLPSRARKVITGAVTIRVAAGIAIDIQLWLSCTHVRPGGHILGMGLRRLVMR